MRTSQSVRLLYDSLVYARHICHAPLTMGTFPVSAGAAVITPQRRLRRRKLYILCFCTGAKAQSCRCSGFSQRIGDSLGSQNKRRRVPPKSLGGREEVSLSPHAVTASRNAAFGFQAGVDRSEQPCLSPPGAVHLRGAPDSLVHGLCTGNAVYSVVKLHERDRPPHLFSRLESSLTTDFRKILQKFFSASTVASVFSY